MSSIAELSQRSNIFATHLPEYTDSSGRIDPLPLTAEAHNRSIWLSYLISAAILCGCLYQFRFVDVGRIQALVPRTLIFWLTFVAYYLAAPASEWIIFRRLWVLPPTGLATLVRKLVCNEILLGYSGEVYFYAWARRHAHVTNAPFGAIKDVTILSALAGNLFTLMMVTVAAPLLLTLQLGANGGAFVLSGAFVLLSSFATLLLRRRLFSLPRHELWIVTGIHLARIATTTVLAAAMWHLLLPAVAVGWWLLLATFRQLLSRLPFLPNKDLVFAGLATFIVGHDGSIVAAMALMATLILAAHLLAGAGLGTLGLLRGSGAR